MTFVMTAYECLKHLASQGPEITAGEIDPSVADPAAIVGHGYDLPRTILASDGMGGETPGSVRFRIVHTAYDTVMLDAGFAWQGPGGIYQSTAKYVLTAEHAHMLARYADEELEPDEAFADAFAGSGVPGTWHHVYPGSDLPEGADDAVIAAAEAAQAYHAMVVRSMAEIYPALVMLSDDREGGIVEPFELPTLFLWLRDQREVTPVP